MSKHIERDLQKLERGILTLGATVEEQINAAIQSLLRRRIDLAKQVTEVDEQIDEREVELEEECLKVLALHQPVAGDLRYIITVLKVNNILERMGDQASNIARCAIDQAKLPPLPEMPAVQEITDQVRGMVRACLDALIQKNPDLARDVLAQDDEVDRANHQIYSRLESQMADAPELIPQSLHMIIAAKNLERIGDLATNIAEDVVFLVEGEIIRHRYAPSILHSQNGNHS
ncbi:phosphate signaling complex protein PhoU [bacterium]|nr:phosphate signaling complex protein PhoU [bacterium]